MKLKLVLPEKGRLTGRSISISTAGVFTFSKELVAEMQIKENDKVNFYQDEENPKDWFLCIEENAQLVIRKYSKKEGFVTVMTNSSDVAKKFRKSLGLLYVKSMKIPVGVANVIDKLKYWPLITAAIK